MFNEIFSAMFSYDPNTLPAEQRVAMADILKTRSEVLRAQAEVADVRARAWAGEAGASDLADIKAQDLQNLRQGWLEKLAPFLKDAVDTDSLMELVPVIVAGALQSFKIPFPIILESVGIDVDGVKMAAEGLKDLLEDL